MKRPLPPLRSGEGLRRDEQGAALVEFAIVLPVLLALLLGALDAGYQLYTRSVLQGEMQKAGRDSTLETSPNRTSIIDDRVTAAVKKVAPNAELFFSRKSYRTFSDAAAAQAEEYTDTNDNGTCDNGEPFEDANNNGRWDDDGGNDGQGGAKDAVVYTATVDYPRLFPLARLIGLPPTVEISATTVLRNQPYTDQDETEPSAGNCE